jgi:hypothetical protein
MVIPTAFSLSAPKFEESRTRVHAALRKSREHRLRTRNAHLGQNLALDMRGVVVAGQGIADAIS